MSSDLTIYPEALPVAGPLPIAAGERRTRWFELCLVLLLSVGPSLLTSVYLLYMGRDAVISASQFRWVVALCHELTGMMLLGYVLWRRGKRIRDLGLSWSFRNLLLGAGLAFGAWLAYFAGYILVARAYHAAFGTVSSGGVTALQVFGRSSLVIIPFMLLNPFFEELIVRAYLMSEVRELTGSWVLAAALSVLLQCSYHLYYGWITALAMGFQFLIFAIYYAKTRKATPIVVAHGIFDIIAMIRLW